MSYNTFTILDQDQKPIGQTYDSTMAAYCPEIRKGNEFLITFEVGKILTGLSKILAGNDKDSGIVLDAVHGTEHPTPRNIAFLKSAIGTIPRSDFEECIETYITELRRIQDTVEDTEEEIEEDPFDINELWIRQEIQAAEAAIQLFASGAPSADHNQMAKVAANPPTPGF